MSKIKLAVILIIILSSFSLEARNKRIWREFSLDLARLVADQDSFVMIQNDKKVGSWKKKVENRDDDIVITGISILDGKVWEDVVVKINRNSLEDYTIDLKMIVGENSIQNNCVINNQKLVGKFTRTVGKSTKFFDLEEDYTKQEIIPRGVFLGLLSTFTNKPGFTKNINFYSPISHSIWPIKFTVKEEETVTVPAGTFKTTPMEILKQGERGVSNIFYIEKDYPHRTVKVDVIEQNMTIELVTK